METSNIGNFKLFTVTFSINLISWCMVLIAMLCACVCILYNGFCCGNQVITVNSQWKTSLIRSKPTIFIIVCCTWQKEQNKFSWMNAQQIQHTVGTFYETVTWEMGKRSKPSSFFPFKLCNSVLHEYANHFDMKKEERKRKERSEENRATVLDIHFDCWVKHPFRWIVAQFLGQQRKTIICCLFRVSFC